MTRSAAYQALTGSYALECESDFDLPVELRTNDGASTPVDTGPLSLVDYDPGGTVPGGGFAGELRSVPGGTLLAEATVSMRGTRSLGTLTIDTNPSDTETVTIGTTVYTFKTTVAADGDVHIGGDAEGSLDHLVAAINGDGDATGPDYHEDTDPHDDVVAIKTAATTIRVEAKTGGTHGDAIATTETLAGGNNAWAATELSGGTGKAGFLVHFDGEDIPSSLVTSGVRRSCSYDVFGIRADASAVKLLVGRATLHASSTDPHA